MQYDRKALKQEARALVRQSRPRAWLVTLILVLLATVLPQAVESVLSPVRAMLPQLLEAVADMARRGVEPDDNWMLGVTAQFLGGGVQTMFLSVLFSLFAIVMGYGYCGYALRLFRRQKAGVGALFSGFPVAGRAIGTYIMIQIFIFLWTLLIYLASAMAAGLCTVLFSRILWLAWAAFVVIVVAAVVLRVVVTLRYCLTPFFVMSDPDKGVFDSITASKTAMRGNYGKRFVLELSFLGWRLLVFLVVELLTALGCFLVMLTAGSQWLLRFVAASRSIVTDEQLIRYICANIVELVESAALPMGAAMVVVWLVTLPLTLWLQAYQTVAGAGFFLIVTGQVIVVADGEEPGPAPEDLVPSLREPDPAPAERPEPIPADPAPEESPAADEPERLTAEGLASPAEPSEEPPAEPVGESVEEPPAEPAEESPAEPAEESPAEPAEEPSREDPQDPQ